MKIAIFLIISFIVIIIAGCRKDFSAADTLQTTQANAESSAASSEDLLSLKKKPAIKYCAFIGPPDTTYDSYSFIMNVAGELGVSYLRDKVPVPGSKKVSTLSSGYKILLNFTGTGTMPMGFRTDTAAYKNDLKSIVSSFTILPEVAVIENEESNLGYYNGTPLEYINELKAAITVMHGYKIPVANGGITSTGLSYLVYEDFINRGLTDKAAAYKSYVGIDLGSATTIDRGNFINILLTNYAVMNLDYVNFHWRVKGPGDSTYLGETIDYLKKTTNKKIITNEFGQYDQDPSSVTYALQTLKNHDLAYAGWYSCFGTRSYPLQDSNQVLNQSGIAFKKFIAK